MNQQVWAYDTPTGLQFGVHVKDHCFERLGGQFTDCVSGSRYRARIGTLDEIQTLQGQGLFIGERDPNQNRDFPGRFMIAEPPGADDPYPTDDASDGRFCIVGDDLSPLVMEALQR